GRLGALAHRQPRPGRPGDAAHGGDRARRADRPRGGRAAGRLDRAGAHRSDLDGRRPRGPRAHPGHRGGRAPRHAALQVHGPRRQRYPDRRPRRHLRCRRPLPPGDPDRPRAGHRRSRLGALPLRAAHARRRLRPHRRGALDRRRGCPRRGGALPAGGRLMRAFVVVAIFGGGFAHATLGPALRIVDVAPDIPLIVVVLLALRRGPEFGCGAGFVAGLLQDAASGGLLCVQALTKALIGFAIGAAGGRLRVSQPLVQVPGLVVLSLLEGLARFGLLQLFHFPAPFGGLMVYVVLPQALYHGFLGAALVLALAWAETARTRPS